MQMQVIVPAGVGPGMSFIVSSPSGQQMQVVCPPNATEVLGPRSNAEMQKLQQAR